MEEISNTSSNKMINGHIFLRSSYKSQTFIGNSKNLFEMLNTEKKKHKMPIYYNFKPKLNILENLKEKEKDYFESYNSCHQCELKINNIYEKGFLQLKKNSLIILRNKIEEFQINYMSDIGVEKIIDLKKYNNSSMNTEASTNISISYNKTTKNNNILLFLDFNLITCKLIMHKTKQKFRLLILGKEKNKEIYQHRVIKFKILNSEKEIFYNICKSIHNRIISSYGYKENIINSSINKFFCKDYMINCYDFYKLAKTCDLILFRSYSCCSRCQRFITKGHYDHIGLLIKFYNELYVYETTGKDGVVVRKWFEFIYYYWYLLCEKITFRKLIASQEAMKKFIIDNNEIFNNKGKKTSKYTSGLSDSNLDNLSKNEIEKQFYSILGLKVDSFVQKAKGKKYFFSIWNYIFKGFYKEKKTENIKNKGYFCSELIAAVYNYCEIISNKMNITNYLPSSFAENGDIKFNEGFSLGPEYIIVFS